MEYVSPLGRLRASNSKHPSRFYKRQFNAIGSRSSLPRSPHVATAAAQRPIVGPLLQQSPSHLVKFHHLQLTVHPECKSVSEAHAMPTPHAYEPERHHLLIKSHWHNLRNPENLNCHTKISPPFPSRRPPNWFVPLFPSIRSVLNPAPRSSHQSDLQALPALNLSQDEPP